MRLAFAHDQANPSPTISHILHKGANQGGTRQWGKPGRNRGGLPMGEAGPRRTGAGGLARRGGESSEVGGRLVGDGEGGKLRRIAASLTAALTMSLSNSDSR